jgi:hypothetical protein
MSTKWFDKVEPVHIPSEKLMEPIDSAVSTAVGTDASPKDSEKRLVTLTNASDHLRFPSKTAEEASEKHNIEIKGRFKPRSFGVWVSAMTTVIGGIYYGWNAGLVVGFGSYLIAQTLMGAAFVILVFSLAEIVSTVFFAGGSYGMARVVLGFYPGYMMASCELLEYLTYTAASFHFIASLICEKLHVSEDYRLWPVT